jgi:autotransporter-associated beta strand protein
MYASLPTRTIRSLLFVIIVAAAAAVPGGPAAAQSIWDTNVNANWNNNANWIGDFPDAIGADAFFNAKPNADITITLTAPVTVGTIMIDNPTSSTITGETITFNDNTAALIEFNGGGNWTISSNIELDSDLTLTGDSDATIDGVIFDGMATNLTKSGSGKVTLDAANLFTGNVNVTDGTLFLNAVHGIEQVSQVNLSGDSILQLGTSGTINNLAAVTMAGTSVFDLDGNNENIGSLAGGPNTQVMLGAGNFLGVGWNNTSTTYSGVISGAGELIKNGTGTFSLNGDNTYTGPTTINNGRLNVNGSVTSDVTATSGSTLGGTGTVQSATINNGAVVDPGTALAPIGTLTVEGNGVPAFTQLAGSTYEVDINDGGTVAGVNNDLIDLTSAVSTASLDGTVSVFDTTGGLGDNYAAGTTFTILQTANPNGVTGTYADVMDNLDLRDARLIHNDDNVQIQLLRKSGDFEAKGLTRNQMNVGRVLDEETPLATGDFGDRLDELVFEACFGDPSLIPGILDTLGGEVHASVAGHMVQQSSRFVEMISRRMRTNSKGDVGMYGSTVQPGAPMLMGSLTVDGLQRVSLTDGGDFVVRAQGVGSPAWGSAYGYGYPVPGQPTGSLWVGGYGVTGDVDGDGNGNPYDYDIYGTVFGIEQQVAPSLLLGLAGGYGRSQVDMSFPNSDADVDSYHVGLYGHYNQGIFYSTGIVAYGYQQYETTRRIPFFGLTANADYDGQQFIAYGEKGLNLCFGGLRVQPLVGLQYIALQRDAFTESGAFPFNLAVAEDHVNSLRLSAGGRIAPELPPGFFGAIIPEFRGRWVHELKDDDQTLSAAFAGGGNNFAVTSAELGRNFGVVGAGITAQLSPLVNLYLDYDYTFSSSLEAHAGSGGLEFLW